jgi:hypothetical protein
MTLKRILLGTFLIWEACWAYLYVTRPRPDTHMQSVAAILFGLILPLFVAGLILIIRIIR